MYLSRKTIQKKASAASSKPPPTHGQQFKRLDTHLLWRSAQCGIQVDQSRIHSLSPSSASSTGAKPIVESSSGLFSPSTPVSMEPAYEVHSSGSVDQKVLLSLPRTQEDWVVANQLVAAVVPSVLSTISVEDNKLLCQDIYNTLEAHFGTRPRQSQGNTNGQHHHNKDIKHHQPMVKTGKCQGPSAAD